MDIITSVAERGGEIRISKNEAWRREHNYFMESCGDRMALGLDAQFRRAPQIGVFTCYFWMRGHLPIN